MPKQENKINKVELEKMVTPIILKVLGSNAFTQRKITDTPTDSLQVTNRKYVNLNGVTANRPIGSILGQFYYDTQVNRPLWWNGTGWIDAAGSYH